MSSSSAGSTAIQSSSFSAARKCHTILTHIRDIQLSRQSVLFVLSSGKAPYGNCENYRRSEQLAVFYFRIEARKRQSAVSNSLFHTRVGTLIVATIYLQLIQNRYMFRSFTVLQCSHRHSVQPVASDVEVVGYL